MSAASMRRRHPLELALLGVHTVLLIFAVAAVAASALPVALRAVLAAAAAAPLALAFPGLLRGRTSTYTWTALVMVLFAGAGVVEVVASLGRSPLVAVMLLAAVVELALLFILSRGARGRSRS
jgi:uncharacterized membrane protein